MLTLSLQPAHHSFTNKSFFSFVFFYIFSISSFMEEWSLWYTHIAGQTPRVFMCLPCRQNVVSYFYTGIPWESLFVIKYMNLPSGGGVICRNQSIVGQLFICDNLDRSSIDVIWEGWFTTFQFIPKVLRKGL